MTRLTLFSAPKPFVDERVSIIQTNAIGSWSKLEGVEVMLLGDGHGIAEVARQLGAKHFPNVRTNSSDTPLISSMIETARNQGQGDVLGIINADMILTRDLLRAVEQVSSRLSEYLLLARRWDMDVDVRLEFSSGWEDRLRAEAARNGRLHKPSGSDVFVFPRTLFEGVPDFAVGRAGWDNWMIYAARKRRIPVVDCTPTVTLVHQNHDYSHLPGGMPHYALPETDENTRLAGGTAAIRYTVLDSTHELREAGLTRPSFSGARLLRRLELLLRRIFAFLPAQAVEAWARPRRWRKRWERLTARIRRKQDEMSD